MFIARRIVVLLIELVAEALLLGIFLAALIYRPGHLFDSLLGSVFALPVMLFLYWYYLTRVFAIVVWIVRSSLYPLIPPILFIIHMNIVYVGLEPMTAEGKATRLPFLLGGMFIVFGCALGGNWVFRRWAAFYKTKA